jgi:hypothetical protein
VNGAPNGERKELSDLEAKRLADYVANRLTVEERRAVEQEILASPAMAAALYEDLGTLEMLDEAKAHASAAAVEPVSSSGRVSPRWWRPRLALSLAAVLALAILTPRILRELAPSEQSGPGGDFRFRSGAPASSLDAPAPAADSPPRGLSPSGDVAGAIPPFVWTRDPAATAYRLELRSEDGGFACSRLTTDTALVIEETLFPWSEVSAATWVVVPLAGTAERPASDSVRIRIVRR